ncbi:MAG: hypothetical protein Q4F79_10345 [Eubacteriales bacterium]|nr:hypothetical protein [Eubacteriales bacterium]
MKFSIDILEKRYYNANIPTKEVGINDERTSKGKSLSLSASDAAVLLQREKITPKIEAGRSRLSGGIFRAKQGMIFTSPAII